MINNTEKKDHPDYTPSCPNPRNRCYQFKGQTSSFKGYLLIYFGLFLLPDWFKTSE